MMTCCCCCGHNQLQRLAARVTVATAQGAFDRHAALANFELESRQQFLATLNAFEDKSVCNIHSNLWVPNNIFPSLITHLFNFIKTMLAAYRLLAIQFVWNSMGANGHNFSCSQRDYDRQHRHVCVFGGGHFAKRRSHHRWGAPSEWYVGGGLSQAWTASAKPSTDASLQSSLQTQQTCRLLATTTCSYS